MIMMGGFELPVKAMRQQVQLRDRHHHPGEPAPGRSEKDHPHHGSDEHGADIIIMQEVFRYKQLGIDQNGRAYGQFEATGCADVHQPLEAKGVKLPSNMFAERVLMRD